MSKIAYLIKSTIKYTTKTGMACPVCRSESYKTIDRKWMVTSLRRCSRCSLLYRAPTTTEDENYDLYQKEYKEGFTTELPSQSTLQELLNSKFRGHEKDYQRYIDVLSELGLKPGDRLFDYGCSWGYGSWQFKQAGYCVESFEISEPRAQYGVSHLGINITPPESIKQSYYDVFFSSHVIEHVPSVVELVTLGMKALRPGGVFIAFTPNGSDDFRKIDPVGYHKMWGLVHPQLIDVEYLKSPALPEPMIVDSYPYSLDIINSASWNGRQIIKTSGPELFFAIRKE